MDLKDLDRKLNPLQFWENNIYKFTMLSAVANAVMAVPATQVTVERAFSALKYIYSDLRANLKEDLLEDILIIKINNAFENYAIDK
jgi:hypothetical protein